MVFKGNQKEHHPFCGSPSPYVVYFPCWIERNLPSLQQSWKLTAGFWKTTFLLAKPPIFRFQLQRGITTRHVNCFPGGGFRKWKHTCWFCFSPPFAQVSSPIASGPSIVPEFVFSCAAKTRCPNSKAVSGMVFGGTEGTCNLGCWAASLDWWYVSIHVPWNGKSGVPFPVPPLFLKVPPSFC